MSGIKIGTYLGIKTKAESESRPRTELWMSVMNKQKARTPATRIRPETQGGQGKQCHGQSGRSFEGQPNWEGHVGVRQ